MSLTPLGVQSTLERVLIIHNFSLSVLVDVVLALRQLLSRIILEEPVVAFSPSTQKAEAGGSLRVRGQPGTV